jgi:medium-chain acyl-[acyl-carrier-protein] hydrolase
MTVARPKPQAAVRLLCFSYAGVGASAYRGWGESAPPELELRFVQLPGRETRLREPAIASMDHLVPPLVHALEPATTDRPYALFGHSLGSLLAFETARALRRLGAAPPVALFVSASRAPHPPIRHLDDVALLAEVHRRYGSVPNVLIEDEELRELLTPALRADMSLVETYRYEAEAPFDFPIVAFGGEQDPTVGAAALEEWKHHTTGPFRRSAVPGDHLFLQSQRTTLLNAIAATLDTVDRPDRAASPIG